MDIRMLVSEAVNFLDINIQSVHKRIKSRDVTYKKSQNRIYFGHETAKALFNLKFDNKVFGFQNLKGGVGKTELAFVTALKANLYGARVLCIDLDMQGNLTEDCFKFKADNHPVIIDVIHDDLPIEKAIVNISTGLDLLPSRIENGTLDNILMLKKLPLDKVYKNRIDELRKHYDFIIIDCPPALGQSVAAAALSVDEIIAPVTPDRRSISGLKLCYEELQRIEKNYGYKVPLRIVINKFDARNTLSHETLSSLVKHPVYGDMLSKCYIRSSQEFPNCVAKNETIFKTLKQTVAREDIDLFVREAFNIHPANIIE